MRIFSLLLVGVLSRATALNFEDSHQDGVTFGEETEGIQSIKVKENNNGGRVKFVLITGVNGSIICNVHIGQEVLLVQVGDGDDETQKYLIANLVDYEELRASGRSNMFSMDVIENGDIANRKVISLAIQNIDDESPSLWGSVCSMKEETVIDIDNSECVFEVSDPDGFLSKMDFSAISGIQDEDELFEFKYKNTPGDDVYVSDVYLVLKEGKTLDYEKLTLYNFRENATDSAGHPTIPQSSSTVVIEVEDISDQPPQWVSFHASVTITEEKQTQIQILAVDGDYGINNQIIYGVVDETGLIRIDGKTGLITVDPISKNAGYDEIKFLVIALEESDPASNIVNQITLVIMY